MQEIKETNLWRVCIGHIFGSLGNQRQKPSERSKPISHSSEDLLFTPRASARCHSLHLSFYEANPLISPAGLHCIAQTSSSPTRASARSPFAQSPMLLTELCTATNVHLWTRGYFYSALSHLGAKLLSSICSYHFLQESTLIMEVTHVLRMSSST